MTDVEPLVVAPQSEPQQQIKTVFNLAVIENSLMYLENKPNPYKIKTEMNEIEMKCELCLDLKCCPEHCCNVSKIFSPFLEYI